VLDGKSLSVCLAELRTSFGYQVDSVKKVGAVCVEASKVDLPSAGLVAGAKPLRNYISKELNDEFNFPEKLAAPPNEDEGKYEKDEYRKEDEHNSNHGFFSASAHHWRHVLRIAARSKVLHLGSGIGGRPN
jgi:hypothetical protein